MILRRWPRRPWHFRQIGDAWKGHLSPGSSHRVRRKDRLSDLLNMATEAQTQVAQLDALQSRAMLPTVSKKINAAMKGGPRRSRHRLDGLLENSNAAYSIDNNIAIGSRSRRGAHRHASRSSQSERRLDRVKLSAGSWSRAGLSRRPVAGHFSLTPK